jgi:type II secretion system protein G
MFHLKDLHCFAVVCELCSFSRAADTLETVQSQVSARVRRLEDFSGTELFVRLHRGVTPTPAGELMYAHAKRVLIDVAQMECAMKGCGAEPGPNPCKVIAALDEIGQIERALDLYRLDTGRFPDAHLGLKALVERPRDEPRWHGPYLRKPITVDPWGEPYQYRVPGEKRGFELVSIGWARRPEGCG